MNSRLGESELDLYRVKIRLGEFKAVYSIHVLLENTVKPVYSGHSMEKQKVAIVGR